jgi:hypothetical protein
MRTSKALLAFNSLEGDVLLIDVHSFRNISIHYILFGTESWVTSK